MESKNSFRDFFHMASYRTVDLILNLPLGGRRMGGSARDDVFVRRVTGIR